ncbi:85_t:CDS:2, partial [Ambispora leptoticha]
MSVANLLDSRICGNSLRPNELKQVIIPYLEDAYTFEAAVYIYRVIQKYITKIDEFSGLLLWALVKYSNPIIELACQVLSIPASSAAVERCWSNFEYIHNQNRVRLNNER